MVASPRPTSQASSQESVQSSAPEADQTSTPELGQISGPTADIIPGRDADEDYLTRVINRLAEGKSVHDLADEFSIETLTMRQFIIDHQLSDKVSNRSYWPWNDIEDQELRKEVSEKMALSELAERHRRSVAAIRARVMFLNLPLEGRKRGRWTIDEEEQLRQLLDEGVEMTEIASRFNRTLSLIERHAAQLELPSKTNKSKKHRATSAKGGWKGRWTMDDRQELCRMLDRKVKPKDMVDHFHCSLQTIYSRIRDLEREMNNQPPENRDRQLGNQLIESQSSEHSANEQRKADSSRESGQFIPLCRICERSPVNTAFQCGHLFVCQRCAALIHLCPGCEKKIEQRLVIHFH